MLIDISFTLSRDIAPCAYAFRGPARECIVLLAIETGLLAAEGEPAIMELRWNGLSVPASAADGVVTASQYGAKKWCWIAATLPPAAVPGHCGLLLRRAEKVIARGEIQLRDHVPLRNVHRSESLLNGLLGELFLRTARPVFNIHFWHEDVAREIAALPGAADRHFEIRLLTPENIDGGTLEQFMQHLRANHRFRRISRLTVPARGRDIGGLVGMLQADARNKSMAAKPQLFAHTKKSSYLPPPAQADWRRGLLSSLVAGWSLRRAIRQLFFPKTAMVCAGERACVEPFAGIAGPRKQSLELADSLAEVLFSRTPAEYVFSAGTMFWLRIDRTARAWTSERLEHIACRLEPSEKLVEPSHAHAFERLFPAAVNDSGFRVAFL